MDPSSYTVATVKTYDQKASVQDDGTILCRLGGIAFPVPKNYIDFPDDFDTNKTASAFISTDPQHDYGSSFAFLSDVSCDTDLMTSEASETVAQKFLSGFFDDVRITGTGNTVSAGYKVLTVDFSGRYKDSFTGLKGYAGDGTLGILCNSDLNSITLILFSQTSGRDMDESGDFKKVLSGAYKIKQ